MSEINPGRDLNRSPLHLAVPLRAPYALQLAPSRVCNFKCHYCSHSVPGGVENKTILSWPEFLKIMEQARELNPKFKIARLVGQGEPLLNPDLPEMVAYISERGLAERIEITTNGSLLTPPLAKSLVEAGLTRLIVSLQGTSAQSYAGTCGVKIDFEQLVANLRYFYQNRGQCVLHLKIVDKALKDQRDEERFFDIFSQFCDTIHINPIVPVYKSVDFSDEIKSRGRLNMQGIYIGDLRCCPQIFFNLTVDPGGDVKPCCADPAPVIGNIHSAPLKEIWNGRAHAQVMEDHLTFNKDRHPACQDCGMITSTMPEDRLDDHAAEILGRLRASGK